MILAFVGVAVFGFTAMNSGHSEGGMACLADIMNPARCDEGKEHLSIFKSFSAAVLVLTVILLLAWTVVRESLEPRSAVFQIARAFEHTPSQYRASINEWFKLSEKRDPIRTL